MTDILIIAVVVAVVALAARYIYKQKKRGAWTRFAIKSKN